MNYLETDHFISKKDLRGNPHLGCREWVCDNWRRQIPEKEKYQCESCFFKNYLYCPAVSYNFARTKDMGGYILSDMISLKKRDSRYIAEYLRHKGYIKHSHIKLTGQLRKQLYQSFGGYCGFLGTYWIAYLNDADLDEIFGIEPILISCAYEMRESLPFLDGRPDIC
jgi:hypothetical protein